MDEEAKAARIAELQKNIRIAELQAKIAEQEAATPERPSSDGGSREFNEAENEYMARSNYGMSDKFMDEASFGFLPKAGAALQAGLGMSSEGGVLNYDEDFSDRYESNLEAEREMKRRYTEENPIKSGSAGVLGAVYGGGGLMKGGATATRFLNSGAKGFKAGAKRFGANVIDAMGFGALHAAGNDEDILKNAATSGAVSAGISTIPIVGRGIANTATARRVSKSLLDKAGNFTPYNLADKSTNYMADFYRNRVGKAFLGKHAISSQSNAAMAREEAKYVEKTLAAGVKAEGGFKNYVSRLYNEALPKGAKPVVSPSSGDTAVAQLKDRFVEGYSKVWDKSRPASKSLVGRLEGIMKTDGLSADALNAFKILKKNVNAHLGKPEANRLIDREIKKYSGSFVQQADNDIVKELTAEVRKNLTKKGAIDALDLDTKYASYLVLKDTAKKAIATDGVFDEKQLMSAIKSVGKNNAPGEEPLVNTGRALYKSTQATKEAEKAALAAHKAKMAAKKAASPPTSTGTMEQLGNTALLAAPLPFLGATGAAATIPVGAGVAKVLAMPDVQRAAAGQLRAQTAGRAALRGYDKSELANALRTGGRAFAATAGN